ncbi:MAG: hypothetical protein RIS64_4361 [Bacteroidota bacterium]|jgi:hypothetical protein
MMKNIWKISLLSILISQSCAANAQNEQPLQMLRAKWGQEYKEPSNSNLSKIIATDGEGFYALRMHRDGLLGGGDVKPIVEYYDKSMKLIRLKELDLAHKGKDRDFKDVIMFGRQLYLLSYFYNEKHEKTYLFAQKIRHSTLQLEPEVTKIEEWNASNKEHADPFGFHLSRDSSKLLVYTHSPFVEKGDKEQFSFHVFAPNVEEMWSKSVKLPYKDENYGIEEYQVDNAGNVYLLGIAYMAGATKLKRDGKPTYYYSILSYQKDAESHHEFKLENRDVFVTDLTFRIADNNHLICTGFYSEKGTFSMKGIYFLNIDPITKEVVTQNLQPLDFSFLTANMSDRSKKLAKEASDKNNKSKEPELANFSLDKLILRSDGGAILVAEQYFVQTIMPNNSSAMYPYGYGGSYYNRYYYTSPFYSGYNNRRPDYYYNYNDIIVVNLRPTGEIEWSSRIPKLQESKNDQGLFSSYSMAVAQDKFYFVYNENPKNLNPKSDRKYTTTTDRGSSVVVVSTVNKDGQVKTTPLRAIGTEKGHEVMTRPKVCRQIGRSEMAIYGEDGRTYRFASLLLE